MYEKRNEYSKNDGSLSNLRCQIDYQILKYTRAYERERDSLRERLSKEKRGFGYSFLDHILMQKLLIC